MVIMSIVDLENRTKPDKHRYAAIPVYSAIYIQAV
jgi:hypothetical protein